MVAQGGSPPGIQDRGRSEPRGWSRSPRSEAMAASWAAPMGAMPAQNCAKARAGMGKGNIRAATTPVTAKGCEVRASPQCGCGERTVRAGCGAMPALPAQGLERKPRGATTAWLTAATTAAAVRARLARDWETG